MCDTFTDLIASPQASQPVYIPDGGGFGILYGVLVNQTKTLNTSGTTLYITNMYFTKPTVKAIWRVLGPDGKLSVDRQDSAYINVFETPMSSGDIYYDYRTNKRLPFLREAINQIPTGLELPVDHRWGGCLCQISTTGFGLMGDPDPDINTGKRTPSKTLFDGPLTLILRGHKGDNAEVTLGTISIPFKPLDLTRWDMANGVIFPPGPTPGSEEWFDQSVSHFSTTG